MDNFGSHYCTARKIASRYYCEFIDGSELELGDDGVHISIKGHEELPELVAEKIKKIYG